MDPSTGEVITGRQFDYNLNDPRTISGEFESNMATELEGMDAGETTGNVKNQAVTS